MSNIDFVKLCESVLEDSLFEEKLKILEEELQQQTQLDKKLIEIANEVKQIIDETEDIKVRGNPHATINARKPELFKKRTKVKNYLNQIRQAAIHKLTPNKEFTPFTEDEVDNYLHGKISKGGIYNYFGKLLQNQFGEEYFPNTK